MKKLILMYFIVILGGVLCAQTEPQWLWATRAGSPADNEAFRVSVDSSGNSYVTGYFSGIADFGTIQLTGGGGNDIFVAKLDPNGNWLWAKRAGGSGMDFSYGICSDSAGNSYITGYFRNTAIFGGTTLTSAGQEDAFIAKLDTNGNWIWALRAGGTGLDVGARLATDSAGNILFTGSYGPTAFFGPFALSGNAGYNVFVAKLDNGGGWLWATQAVGTGNMYGNDISTDGVNCYIIGGLFETLTFGTETLTSAESWDICFAKLDANGNWLWVKLAGGADEDAGYAISSDSSGNCLITGYFMGTAGFGLDELNSAGAQDIFIARLTSSGSLLWVKRVGGGGMDYGGDTFSDNNCYCHMIGTFSESFMFENWGFSSEGATDVLIVKLDGSGNLISATSFGSSGVDAGFGIVTDGGGNYHVCGTFSNSVAFGDAWLSSAGGLDIWVGKLSTGVGIDGELAPEITGVSSLSAAWPNPFHSGGTTTLKAHVAQRETGTLTLYNLRGQAIQSHQLSSGLHEISINGTGLPAGIYLYKLQTPSVTTTRKLVLLK